MQKMDKAGVAWGIVFSVFVNGIYNLIVSILNNFKIYEPIIIGVATFVTGICVVYAFRKILFPNDYVNDKTNKELAK